MKFHIILQSITLLLILVIPSCVEAEREVEPPLNINNIQIKGNTVKYDYHANIYSINRRQQLNLKLNISRFDDNNNSFTLFIIPYLREYLQENKNENNLDAVDYNGASNRVKNLFHISNNRINISNRNLTVFTVSNNLEFYSSGIWNIVIYILQYNETLLEYKLLQLTIKVNKTISNDIHFISLSIFIFPILIIAIIKRVISIQIIKKYLQMRK